MTDLRALKLQILTSTGSLEAAKQAFAWLDEAPPQPATDAALQRSDAKQLIGIINRAGVALDGDDEALYEAISARYK